MEPTLGGWVKRVHDRGFGFIRDDAGTEWFFHRSACDDTTFDELQVGDRVLFRVGGGGRSRHVAQGPVATAVRRA